MFNVCPNCGEVRADKVVVDGPYAICPVCKHKHAFVRLPLFIITGASGVGKTTASLAIAAQTKDFVVMESDILYSNEVHETDYRTFREMWLRVCKNISQSGKCVLLSGASIPEQFEQCVERRYFSEIHYLALVCEDGVLESRLRARPAWRRCSDDEYINRHLVFNRWLRENSQTTQPPMTLLDTTELTVDKTAEQILQWARRLSE